MCQEWVSHLGLCTASLGWGINSVQMYLEGGVWRARPPIGHSIPQAGGICLLLLNPALVLSVRGQLLVSMKECQSDELKWELECQAE